jgi:hypothetical protein
MLDRNKNQNRNGSKAQRWAKSVVDAGLVPAICFESSERVEAARADVNYKAADVPGLTIEFGDDLFAHLRPYPENDVEGKVFFVAFDEKAKKALAAIEVILRDRNDQYKKARKYRELIQYSVSLPWLKPASEVEVADDGQSANVIVYSRRPGNFPYVHVYDTELGRRVFKTPTVFGYMITLAKTGEVIITQRIWKCRPVDPTQSYLQGLEWVPVAHGEEAVENVFDEKDFLKKFGNSEGFVGYVKAMIRRLEDELGIERNANGEVLEVATAGGGSLAQKLRELGVLAAVADPDETEE